MSVCFLSDLCWALGLSVFLVEGLMLAIGFVCFFVNLYIYPENLVFCKTRIGHLGLGNTEEASGHLRKLGLNQGLAWA